jgi:2-keto-3-deoxy-L-fuconate dehydrogenase
VTDPTNGGRSDFEGLNCLVTGSASGIGRATCALLLERGAFVVGVDRHPGPALGQLQQRIVDVGDSSSVAALASDLTDELGRLDVLVNCAGISPLGNVEETTEADWDATFAVNTRGPWLMTRALLPLLRRSDRAAIVNVASGIGLRPVPGFAAYAASKAALISLTRSTAIEYGHEGIRANCVCPGPTDTPLMRWAMKEMGREEPDAANYPAPRLADPRELAEAIVLLCSPSARSIVGSTLAVDGGRTLH